MKLDCEVIEDLLPLYVEDLASGKSRELVEEHIATCEKCKTVMERMQQSEPKVNHLDEAEPFKKIRKKMWRDKVTTAAISAFFVVAVVIILYGKFFLRSGDEMGYVILDFYICLPLTALICSIIAGMRNTKIKWIVPVLFGVTGWFLPLIMFQNTDGIFVFFSLVPSCIGIGIGLIIRIARKTEKKIDNIAKQR